MDPASLRRVLDAARFAPSGGNRQGWRVIVITDADLRRKIRELYGPHWAAYTEQNGARAVLDAGGAPGLSPGRLRMLQAADEYAQTFDRVPVHLVLCVQLDALAVTDDGLDRQSIVGGASIYPFVQNILLGLRGEELGASFTTLLVPGRAGAEGAARHPGRGGGRRSHLGRPSCRSVAAAPGAQPGGGVHLRRAVGRGVVSRAQRRACSSRRLLTPSLR